MLSINYIINFLSEKQNKINNNFYNDINEFEKNEDMNNIKIDKTNIQNNLDKYNYYLPESFDFIFNKNKDFYYDSKIYKNRSPVFTLFNSLFLITNRYFNLNSENEKELIIKDFIKKIDNDLFEKNLYYKFNYNKNRNFNKSDIQLILKNSLFFKNSDKFELLKEYVSDFLGINIYIFNINNKIIDFSKSEYYLTKYYNNNINKYIPHFIILHENDIYKPLIMNSNDESSILKYTINNNIIDNIWNYFKLNDLFINNNLLENNLKEDKLMNENIKEDIMKEDIMKEDKIINENIIDNELTDKSTVKKYNIQFLNKLKIDLIKDICKKENIELLKKSDKTSNMINKLKNELINELLNI